MVDFYKGKIPIIRRSIDDGFLQNGMTADPSSFGCIPRDYEQDPVLMGDSPSALKLYDDSELDAVFDEQEEQESSLEHMFLPDGKTPAFINLDQNGDGYCWGYSTGHAIMFDMLKRNYPVLRVNPHATCAIIKRGRDEGGWCGLSGKWGRDNGYALDGTGVGEWPGHSRDVKRYDTPELRRAMARHKVAEDWYDLGRPEWDQTLAKRQIATLGSSNVPCPVDYSRFAHSMCMIRYVRIERNSWGVLVINSWKHWGYHGLGVLAEMYPDNAIGIRATTPSAA